MTAPATYTLAATAARCGVSACRLRRAWRTWAEKLAFPSPIIEPPAANYAWDRAGVEAWVEARQRGRLPVAPALKAPANEDGPPKPAAGSPADQRLRRERAELHRLMENA